MIEFVGTYTYLALTLILLCVFALLCWLLPRHRHLMLLGGLLGAPQAFLAVFFVPRYWHPVQLFWVGAGPEDLMFSFVCGGLAWLVVPIAYRGAGLLVKVRPVPLARTYSVAWVGVLALWKLVGAMGVTVMWSCVIVLAACLGVMLVVRPELREVASAGALFFSVPYTLFVSLSFVFFPNFVRSWNLADLSGIWVLGIPVEEVVWSIMFGATWPLALCWLLNVEIQQNVSRSDGRILA